MHVLCIGRREDGCMQYYRRTAHAISKGCSARDDGNNVDIDSSTPSSLRDNGTAPKIAPGTNDLTDTPHTGPEYVHISWAGIIGLDHAADVFVIESTDAHYRLYSDCLRYLQREHSTAPWSKPAVDALMKSPLARLPSCFGILVNVIADQRSAPDLHSADVTDIRVKFDSHSMLDFMLWGMLAVVATRTWRAPTLPAGETFDAAQESVLFRSILLECFTTQWRRECQKRRAMLWSPMPWSRASAQELVEARANPNGPTPPVHIINANILQAVTEDHPLVLHARSRCGSPLDVPWLGASHDGYPFCSTFSEYVQVRRTSATQSLRDDAALWISAMSLGLLEAVMHMRIPQSLLLVPGEKEGEEVLSGDRILRILVAWWSRVLVTRRSRPPGSDDGAHLDRGRDVVRLLERARNALDEECETIASVLARSGHKESEVVDMVGAVALVMTPVYYVVQSLWNELPEVQSFMSAGSDSERPYNLAAAVLCANRMQRAGWCPYTASMGFLLGLVDPSLMSNLVKLPPYIRSAPDEHKDCNESACVFYIIADTDAYVPRHVHPACACGYIKPSLDDLVRLLSEGIVPVIAYDGNALRVLPSHGTPYVAISHVWADGMGSTTEEGLPTCVVERIAALVKTLLPEPCAFWLDSLCVPSTRSVRKRAIKLMARTYEEASKVLVIDLGIRMQCSVHKSWEENLFRIAMSAWMRRVWTLQEGLLARELWFEFSEGPVDVEAQIGTKNATDALPDSSTPYDTSWAPSAQFPVPPHLLPLWHIPVLRFRASNELSEAGHNLPLGEAITLLASRATTRAEDELLAISTLHPPQVDIDVLLSIGGHDAAQERMKSYFLQLREVSLWFPMWMMPRLQLPGFTWAPRALATAPPASASLEDGVGICTQEGLLAEYFVATFEEDVVLSLDNRAKSSEGFFLRVAEPGSRFGPMFNLLLDMEVGTHGETIPVINSLISLEETFTREGRTRCAAVCYDGGKNANSKVSESGETPLRFTFVASGLLHPINFAVNALPAGVLPVLRRPIKTRVCLR
ncbi:hypothetical protein C8Q79DRAFT_1100056 [Trametes meyenii]|nr:hypothetical protein C8Q79DRAFT_1100056 [Trametes meyenii]